MQLLSTENDFITSLEKSLSEIDNNWKSYHGLIIAGSHNQESISEKILAIKVARERKIPFLGICLGMQLTIIEFARNFLGIEEATSSEFEPDTFFDVVTRLPKMRTGIKKVVWNDREEYESHWHQYAFNNKYMDDYSQNWKMSITDNIVEIMQLYEHPFFVGVQFHPEYNSSNYKPHWVLKRFIDVCKQSIVDTRHH